MTAECAHHWVIEAAGIREDGMSRGVCGKCGSTRMFANNLDSLVSAQMARRGKAGAKSRWTETEEVLEEELVSD